MVEAKDLAAYVVEPIGTNINSPSSFTVRKRFQDIETTTTYTSSQVSTMFQDISNECTRPTASGSNMKGGIIYVKNGTYSFQSAGFDPGNATDGPNVMLRIVGETRERTIFKTAFNTVDDIIQPDCSLDVENITFSGADSDENVSAIHPNDSADAPLKILRVYNCRFTNQDHYDILVGHNQYGIDISHCIFDTHQELEDQVAIECTGWMHMHDCLFDRTAGQPDGSCFTTGSAYNADIHNNIFKRTNVGYGISFEPYDVNPDNDYIHIHDNFLEKAAISVGGSGSFATTMHHITIEGNLIKGAYLQLHGPDSGDPTGLLKDIVVQNNSIFDSDRHGMNLYKTGGFTVVSNNVIKNSNGALSASTDDKPCIYIDGTIDLICEDNRIFMETGAANFTPYGIRYVNTTNLVLRGNRIVNKTANPSYASAGSHTGTTKVISRSL